MVSEREYTKVIRNSLSGEKAVKIRVGPANQITKKTKTGESQTIWAECLRLFGWHYQTFKTDMLKLERSWCNCPTIWHYQINISVF